VEFVIGGLIIVVVYLLKSSGLLPGSGIAGIPGTSTASGTAAPIVIPAQPGVTNSTLAANFATTTAVTQASVGVGTQAASTIAKTLGAAAPALNAIPVIGAAFAALTSILLAESKKRAQEAVNENQAVDAAIPAWDAAIQQCVQLFNSGQITLTQLGQVIGTPRTQKYFGVPVGMLWNNFWTEVGPQVQPGRNGCKSGTVTQPGDSSSTPQGTSFCTGSYGAGCCIAYGDMDNSMGNPNNGLCKGNTPGQLCVIQAAQMAAKNPNIAFTAVVLPIYSSKYSTYARGSYQVTLCAPAITV
jgi:hypothetical protein